MHRWRAVARGGTIRDLPLLLQETGKSASESTVKSNHFVSKQPHPLTPSSSVPASAPVHNALPPPPAMPATLPRRRLLDLFLTGLLTSLISIFPFVTVRLDTLLFQPPPARLAFLLAIVLSWPCNLASALLSLAVYALHRRTAPDVRRLARPDDDALLAALVVAAAFAVLGVAFLLVAQAIWVYVAAEARVVWLLALVVLGLALLVVLNASLVVVCIQGVRIRAAHLPQRGDFSDSKRVVLQLGISQSAIHDVEASFSTHDSDLVF